MEVTWRNVTVVDGAGRVTAAGYTILREELQDERLAVLTVSGPHASALARRHLFTGLLHAMAPTAAIETGEVERGSGDGDGDVDNDNAGVTLVACVSYMEEDYRLLLLDVADADSLPVGGALFLLSSLVLSTCASTADMTRHALPAPSGFLSTLATLERDLSAVEIYAMLPAMLTLDVSEDAALRSNSSSATIAATEPTPLSAGLRDLVHLKTQGVRTQRELLSSSPSLSALAGVKQVFQTDLTGDLLASLLQPSLTDSHHASERTDLDLCSAWDAFTERQSRLVAADAEATYVDCVHAAVGESPPMAQAAFDALHDEMYRLAMDVFHSGARWRASSRRDVRSALKATLRQRGAEQQAQLVAHSRRFCESLRESLWAELSAPLRLVIGDGQASSSSSSSPSSAPTSSSASAPSSSSAAGSGSGSGAASSPFRMALAVVRQFDDSYSARAAGPERDAVLREFYRHEAVDVFQQLEKLAQAQLSEAHVAEQRAELVRAFDAKKAALVAHFEREEAQLHTRLARELEMADKLQRAKSARVKMDEHEATRLRDERQTALRERDELEARLVVLQHAHDEALRQRHALDAKVDELETAVRSEMSSRAELVDTLAATIRASEEREAQLRQRVQGLEIEVGERAARVEGERRELSLQLRKTNEEKEELQSKLNEFFLKVTALPDALQQHLFCVEQGSTGKVEFADALASFMND